MRHFPALFAPTALSLGMGVAPTSAGLVALSSCAHAACALLGRAIFAVAISMVAATAHQHRVVAASAQVTPGRGFHRQNVADGGWVWRCLAFREILTPATSPSRARGTTSVGTCNGIGRCRACFLSFYGKTSFYPLLDFLTTRSGQDKSVHAPIHHTPITSAARQGEFALALRAPSNSPWRANTKSSRIPLPPDLRPYWQPFTARAAYECWRPSA